MFIDCNDSFCMDPVKLKSFCVEECIWNGISLGYYGAKVKPIVVVHVLGNMADMEANMSISTEYGLKVIEDAT